MKEGDPLTPLLQFFCPGQAGQSCPPDARKQRGENLRGIGIMKTPVANDELPYSPLSPGTDALRSFIPSQHVDGINPLRAVGFQIL